MKANNRIAVIGGGGRTGKYLVNQLFDSGFQIRLLLRNPEVSKRIIPLDNPAVQVVKAMCLTMKRCYH